MGGKRIRGFTLIELLIVVAIIAILAAIAVPNFLEAQTRAKVARVKADQRSIATAIESYAIDFNRAPIGDFEQTYMAPPNALIAPEGKNGKIYSRMTTPVAYITAVPLDPFYILQVYTAGRGRLVVDTILAKAYDYNEYDFTFGSHQTKSRGGLLPDTWGKLGEHWFPYQPTKANLPGYIAPRGFYGPFQKAIMWSLTSAGPTRKLRRNSPFNPWTWGINRILAIPDETADIYVAGFYDPTNGTVSPGMIVRTTRGIEPN